MSYLTLDERRKLLLRGAARFEISSISRHLNIVELTARTALESRDLAGLLGGGEEKQRDAFLALLENSCADEQGDRITRADAEALWDVLSISEIRGLSDAIAASLSKKKDSAPGNS